MNSVYPSTKSIEHLCYQIVTNNSGTTVAEEVGTVVLEGYDKNSFGAWMIPIPQGVIEFCSGNMENPVRNGVSSNW